MKYTLLLLLFFLFTGIDSATAQELNCDVTVITVGIPGTQKRVYETLEQTVEDFMNNRKWTEDEFEFEEKIEVTIQITVREQISLTQFRGDLQIQSSRPIYNSDYKSPLFFVNDPDFMVTFQENSLIQFGTDQHRDNLSSILGFYAYMILGFDYDSFGLESGTPYFLKAQQVVANAQTTAEPGWRGSESKNNRYWLVENILSQTFFPIRECNYNYHRLGFDKLFTHMTEARQTIANALIELRKVHQVRPSSYNMKVFLFPKVDEIVNLFKPVPEGEKTRLFDVLKLVDPGNIQNYERMMKG